MKRLVGTIIVALLLIAPNVAMGAAEITPSDLENADAERRAIARELSAIVGEYDAALDESYQLETRIRDVAAQLSAQEAALVGLRADGKRVAGEIYMTARNAQFATLFEVGAFSDVPVATGYLDLVNEKNDETMARLTAAEASYADQKALLDDALARQLVAVAEVAALADTMMARLEAADAEYRGVVAAYEAQEAEKARIEAARIAAEQAAAQRAAEAAAAAAAATTTTTSAPTASTTTTTVAAAAAAATTTTTAAPPPAPSASRVCPVAGASTWYNDWLAPRSGGRLHQGIDMIAVRGTPLVAIEAGVILRIGTTSALGGNTIWLRGNGGDEWYYAHMDTHAAGLFVGQSVAVGQAVGTVGSTGNASYTVPHLHFEYHPGGGSAAYPHDLIASLCG
ncbi:MAG: M23 family metallopeptidase [Acidimicrobiia bacterium]|nr:M23 family metallopeptidase [Acidimicrobiia bacterium]